GPEVATVETTRPGHATNLARQAATEAYEVAVAVGGDGTINEVCNGLAGSETALGVLPAGTANVFAADVRIPIWWPLNPDAVYRAADILVTGQRRRLDLGSVRFPDGQSRYFLMWCGIGLDAAISESKRSREDGKRTLGYASWIISGLLTTFDFMGTPTTLTTDSTTIHNRLLMAVVSNGQLYGRLWRLAPKAQMDDGLLDVGVMTGHGWPATMRHLIGVTIRQHVRDPNFKLYRTRHLSLASKEPLPVHVDAETIGTTPVQIEIAPGALRVMIPRNAPQHLFHSSN
ncbi:MAG: diacylglycerol kinase family lipid kinase, partial [Anaerolineae bacterium]|nr:diacylglycerol kinase family lipid kinase [Anaerolineae bacterium]